MDKALEQFVTVYSSLYNYMVVIGTEVYEMSIHASAPNGVNMYGGSLSEYDLDESDKVSLADMRTSMKMAIADRIYFDVAFAQTKYNK